MDVIAHHALEDGKCRVAGAVAGMLLEFCFRKADGNIRRILKKTKCFQYFQFRVPIQPPMYIYSPPSPYKGEGG